MKHSIILKSFLVCFFICICYHAKAQFYVNNIKYQAITSSTVFVTHRENNLMYSGDITIPDTITYNGTKYDVTGINGQTFYANSGLTSIILPNTLKYIYASAFLGCTGLTSFTLPSNLISIADYAFYYCTGLTSITILNPQPPTLGKDVFTSVNLNNVTLYVPSGAGQRYRNWTGWGDLFPNITEIVPNAVENTASDPVKVYTEADFVIVNGVDQGKNIKVYNDSGVEIKSIDVTDKTIRFQLSKNQIYFIQIGETSHKVIL